MALLKFKSLKNATKTVQLYISTVPQGGVPDGDTLTTTKLQGQTPAAIAYTCDNDYGVMKYRIDILYGDGYIYAYSSSTPSGTYEHLEQEFEKERITTSSKIGIKYGTYAGNMYKLGDTAGGLSTDITEWAILKGPKYSSDDFETIADFWCDRDEQNKANPSIIQGMPAAQLYAQGITSINMTCYDGHEELSFVWKVPVTATAYDYAHCVPVASDVDYVYITRGDFAGKMIDPNEDWGSESGIHPAQNGKLLKSI